MLGIVNNEDLIQMLLWFGVHKGHQLGFQEIYLHHVFILLSLF